MIGIKLSLKINLATKTFGTDGRHLGDQWLLQIAYVNDNAHLYSIIKSENIKRENVSDILRYNSTLTFIN